jgi:hypothetical protein
VSCLRVKDEKCDRRTRIALSCCAANRQGEGGRVTLTFTRFIRVQAGVKLGVLYALGGKARGASSGRVRVLIVLWNQETVISSDNARLEQPKWQTLTLSQSSSPVCSNCSSTIRLRLGR